MATVVFVLIVATFVVNSIVARSETAWWRDPGSLLREGGALYFGGPTEEPAAEGRKPVPPGTVASPEGCEAPAHRHPGSGSWDAVADQEPVTEVLPRLVPARAVSRRSTQVPEWETEIIRRVLPPGTRR